MTGQGRTAPNSLSTSKLYCLFAVDELHVPDGGTGCREQCAGEVAHRNLSGDRSLSAYSAIFDDAIGTGEKGKAAMRRRDDV